ncbi:hypothetical protein KFE98_00985 [bacterium SCSIO 12741]|nr:hypothetical protein KFE98_00985 [bacterium SCSIO 12741]
MKTQELTEQESLQIITTMIDKAKGKVGEDSIFYLLWGWSVLIGSVLHFLLMNIQYDKPWIPWAILMPATSIAAGIIGSRRAKKKSTRGYIDRLMGYLWGAFVVTLLIVLASSPFIGWMKAYSLMISLYGLATFVSGGVLQFRPLIIGGISAWVISVVSFFLPEQWVVLAVGLSMITSYLIPGYLLKKAHREKKA